MSTKTKTETKTETTTAPKGAQHTPGPWTHKTLFPAMGGMVFEVNSNDGNVMKIRGGCIPIKQDADLIAAAPELKDMLVRLTEKVERANALQHSGGTVDADDWAELYQLTNEARAAIAKATGQE